MKHQTRAGVSSRELTAILLVGAVLGFAFVQGFIRRNVTDQRATTILRMQQIETALQEYAIDNAGVFPTTNQSLPALLEVPTRHPKTINWNGPYLKGKNAINDGWGRPFHYAAPGNGNPSRCYDVWSNGADNAEGGEGPNADISSWDRSTQLP